MLHGARAEYVSIRARRYAVLLLRLRDVHIIMFVCSVVCLFDNEITMLFHGEFA